MPVPLLLNLHRQNRHANHMTNKIFIKMAAFAIITSNAAYAVRHDNASNIADKTASTNNLPDNSGLSDSSRIFDLDEVVVISQPKEVQTLRRQPLSSTMFTGRDLAITGARDLSDIASLISVICHASIRLTAYIIGICARDWFTGQQPRRRHIH